MRILLVGSSCRNNGNTQHILDLLEEDLSKLAAERKLPLETEQISLGKENILFCRGCRLCFDKGENFCPQKDNILPLYAKMLNADAVVLASPVYVEDVNGVMKTFIDRLAFNCHRPAFFGKCAAVLSTSAAGSSNHSLSTMSNALSTWGFRVVSKRKFKMGARMDLNQAKALFEPKIHKLAKELIDSVQAEAVKSPSLFSLIAFSTQRHLFRQHADDNSIDTLYWKNHGWLDQSSVYYTNKKINAVKVLFAKFISAVVLKFVVS